MTDDMIELVAPGGCDEANHDAVRYRVDNNGRVRVPREAAFWLIRAGGFRVADPETPIFTTTEQPSAPPETTAPNDEAGADPTASPRRVPQRSRK